MQLRCGCEAEFVSSTTLQSGLTCAAVCQKCQKEKQQLEYGSRALVLSAHMFVAARFGFSCVVQVCSLSRMAVLLCGCHCAPGWAGIVLCWPRLVAALKTLAMQYADGVLLEMCLTCHAADRWCAHC